MKIQECKNDTLFYYHSSTALQYYITTVMQFSKNKVLHICSAPECYGLTELHYYTTKIVVMHNSSIVPQYYITICMTALQYYSNAS